MIQFRLLFLLMAFMKRRWKGLVVLNVFAVAVFITFSTKYDVWMNKFVTGHTHLNRFDSHLKMSHEVLHKRIVVLEDVVYKELSGLSKSIGLIEGFKNKSFISDTLSPEEEKKAKDLREKYGYNAFLSDRISLDRSIPDYRPSKCKSMVYPRDLPQISIIFIFVNEAMSVILRSLHSAINNTPPHLLKEIILVDDYSDDEQLKGPLEEYVNKRYPGLVKIVRNQKRQGLIRARIAGWKVATGEVTGFFDAHMEFTPVWAEPVLSRIKEDHKRIILPSIDNIKHQSFDLERYENSAHGYSWELWCMYISPPQQWLDEGDPSAPIRTPAMIGCSFVANRQYFGELGLLDSGMNVYGGENIELGIKLGRYTKEGYLFVGPLGSTGDDTSCIIDDITSSYPRLVNCDNVSNIGQKTWNFAQNKSIVNRATGRCLEVVKAKVNFDHSLVLQACTGQRWTIKNTVEENKL